MVNEEEIKADVGQKSLLNHSDKLGDSIQVREADLGVGDSTDNKIDAF